MTKQAVSSSIFSSKLDHETYVSARLPANVQYRTIFILFTAHNRHNFMRLKAGETGRCIFPLTICSSVLKIQLQYGCLLLSQCSITGLYTGIVDNKTFHTCSIATHSQPLSLKCSYLRDSDPMCLVWKDMIA